MKKTIGSMALLLGTAAVLLQPVSALARDHDDYYGHGYDRHREHEWREHERHEWREHEGRERYYRYNRPYSGGAYYYSAPPAVQPYSGGGYYYNAPPTRQPYADPYNGYYNSAPPANNGYYDSNGVWRPYGY